MEIVNNKKENTLAVILHLSGFLNGIFPIVVPLVIWLSKKDESSFLNEHGKSALNFQLTILVLGITAIVFTVFTLGLGIFIIGPVAVILGIIYTILIIIAAVNASEGKYYKYPFSIQFLK